MQYQQVEFGQASMITNHISSSHPSLKEADRQEEGGGGAESQGTNKQLPKYVSTDALMSAEFQDRLKSCDMMLFYDIMISVHLVNSYL